MLKTPRGTKDILIEESPVWQKIESKSRETFNIFGYKEIRTPIMEDVGVFIRSLGEASDIVDKQIFNVSIHKNEEKDAQLALRPEGTAGIIRSYTEHNLDKKNGFVKLYYMGPMFRAERPQKGRLRQFNHIGAEAIGSPSAYLDVEIINLAISILDTIGIKDYNLRINNLGCGDDKKNLSNLLKKTIKPILKELCPNCNNRFSRNILRILDCKNKKCKDALKNTLEQSEFKNKTHLCESCQSDTETIQRLLSSLNIKYTFDPFLVRGLDYYTKTVFEINHSNLGAQDAIGAGGRYDNLVKEFGGPDVGAVGFALGVERIIIAGASDSKEENTQLNTYIISLGEAAKEKTIFLLNELRKEGISSDTDYENKSLKAQMRKANDLSARFVCIIGEDELTKGTVTVRDMSSGQQEELNSADFIKTMKAKLQTER